MLLKWLIDLWRDLILLFAGQAQQPPKEKLMLPQDLIDLLNTAETKLNTAKDKDTAHDAAAKSLVDAQTAESTAAADALAAHQDANSAAADALAALKAHFGVP